MKINTDNDTDYEYYGNGTKCYQEVYKCSYDTAKNNAAESLAKDYIYWHSAPRIKTK